MLQEEQYRYVVPRRLDDPPKFLFWDFDVFMVFMIIVSIGLLTGFPIIGFPGGIFLAGVYQKTKSGKTRGYGRHLIYWYMPFNTGFKRLPPSGNRYYQG